MIFHRTVNLIGNELLNKYDISSTIHHKGERGRQREQGLALVLRELLPEAYGVGTGEILSAYDDRSSPQCDIIIYDRLRFPILGKSSSVQQIPFEAVYAIIESKSIVDTAALRDTEAKFKAIRNIKRVPVRLPKNVDRGPIYILFGYQLATTIAACKKSMERGSRRKGDGMMAILGHGNGIWISENRAGYKRTRTLIWLDDEMLNTLAFFIDALILNLASTDLGKPSMLLTMGQFGDGGR